MTASSTCRSRSLSDAAVILPNPFGENNLRRHVPPGQVADQRVEPQPAFRGAHQPLPPHLHPAPVDPDGKGRPLPPHLHPAPVDPDGKGRKETVGGGKMQTLSGAQRQRNPLEIPVLVAERPL